jgi:anti-sigma factor ChrR (cupin superfamily)
MHDVLDDVAKETVASYVAGLLDREAGALFERHVDAGCPACRVELDALNAVAGLLILAAPLATPPARLRERIRQIPRASYSLRSEDGVWKPFCDGIAMKNLDFDAASRTSTFLCRMEPGASIPPHHHPGPEQCYLVSGEAIIEGTTYRAGDYVRESAGTNHSEVHTKTGCLLLLIAFAGPPVAKT